MSGVALHAKGKCAGRERMRGFTLIELIVATAILVILTSMAVPGAGHHQARERARAALRPVADPRRD